MSDLTNVAPTVSNAFSTTNIGSGVEDLYSMDDLLPVSSEGGLTSATSQMDVTINGIGAVGANSIVGGMGTTSNSLPNLPNYVNAAQLTEPIRTELIQMEPRFQFDSNIELSIDQQAFIIRCSLSKSFLLYIKINISIFFRTGTSSSNADCRLSQLSGYSATRGTSYFRHR